LAGFLDENRRISLHGLRIQKNKYVYLFRGFYFTKALVTLALFLSFVFVSPAYASKYQRAVELYNNGEFLAAAEIWQNLAGSRSDSGVSFHQLAEMYKLGIGFDKNEGFASHYYKKAAAKGYIPSMHALGLLYYVDGSEALRHTNSSIYWWEKAARKGYKASIAELARLFFHDAEKQDVILAREYAKAAIAIDKDYTFAIDIFKKTSDFLKRLNLGGSRDLRKLDPDYFQIELLSTDTFSEAWLFVVVNKLNGAYIHRSVYNDFVVSIGYFPNVESAYTAIANFPKNLLEHRPKPRNLLVTQHELLPEVRLDNIKWLTESIDTAYTVELLRSDSHIDAYDFVDANQLQNSGVYTTINGESVVVAGLFDSIPQASSVIKQLPVELSVLKPSVRLVADTRSEMMPLRQN